MPSFLDRLLQFLLGVKTWEAQHLGDARRAILDALRNYEDWGGDWCREAARLARDSARRAVDAASAIGGTVQKDVDGFVAALSEALAATATGSRDAETARLRAVTDNTIRRLGKAERAAMQPSLPRVIAAVVVVVIGGSIGMASGQIPCPIAQLCPTGSSETSPSPSPSPVPTASPQPESGADREPQPESGADREPQPESGADREPQPESGADREPQPESGADREPQPESGADREPQPESGADREPQPESGADREPQPESGADREPQPVAQPSLHMRRADHRQGRLYGSDRDQAAGDTGRRWGVDHRHDGPGSASVRVLHR